MRIQPTDKAQFAVDFIDLPKAANVEGAVWEDFQLSYLNNQSRFGIDVKARQIAWSFTSALDAVCDSFLHPGNPHIFVSINQEESQEKIRYVNAIYEAIDEPVRQLAEIVSRSMTHIEFSNGSRFLSHPQRPPRGKPKARIYLDEMAHYADNMDRDIYKAALPATTKGDGYIRIGSSPFGAKGLFWEIYTQAMRGFPGYKRGLYPWWEIRALCVNVLEARKLAPFMSTEERVNLFGTKALKEIYENMFLEDFQQEYECSWIDEVTAWIGWETIKSNQDANLLHWHAKSVGEAVDMVPLIFEAIRANRIEATLCGGLDVGRKRDLTEFFLLGRGEDRFPVRFMVSLDRVRFDDQQACFTHILENLPVTRCLVDRNGIGMQLAEALEKTGRAAGVDFTNESKEEWAVEARLQTERYKTPLPPNRDLAYQIHSIKKTSTSTKMNRFDNDRNDRHHADKFWAWALAIYACKTGYSFDFGETSVDGVADRWR